MKLSGILCPEGHKLGNITYKMEVGDETRKLVRKIIDDVFYCQSCKKFYKFTISEVEFTPKAKGEKKK